MRKTTVWILIAVYVLLIVLLTFGTPLLSTIEKHDIDKSYWTTELPQLLRGEPTPLSYPDLRFLSPALALGISAVLPLSILQSMILLSILFGCCSLFFLMRAYGKEPDKLYIGIFFIVTPTVLLYSVTYFVEIANLFFAIAIFYLAQRAVTEGSRKSWLLLALVTLFGMLNKEQILLYLIAVLFIFILLEKKYNAILPAISLLVFAGIILYLNYVLLFHALHHLILNANTFNTLLIYRLTTLWHNITSLNAHALILLIGTLIFSYGALWILAIIGWIHSDSKTKIYAIFFLVISFGLILINQTTSKYVVFSTLPCYLPLMAQGFYQLTRRYTAAQKYVVLGGVVVVNLACIGLYMYLW